MVVLVNINAQYRWLIPLKSVLFPFSFIDIATELYRDDLNLQTNIAKTRENVEKYPYLCEALLRSEPDEIEKAEKKLAEKKSEDEQNSTKEVEKCSSQPVDRWFKVKKI